MVEALVGDDGDIIVDYVDDAFVCLVLDGLDASNFWFPPF